MSVAYPPGWSAEIEHFPTNRTSLIRFWQGNDPAFATIQLDIKENWDNFSVSSKSMVINEELGITAAYTDPPAIEETTLDRYLSLYGFEYQEKVYALSCVHNWIPEIYTQCQNMLRSMAWTE